MRVRRRRSGKEQRLDIRTWNRFPETRIWKPAIVFLSNVILERNWSVIKKAIVSLSCRKSMGRR